MSDLDYLKENRAYRISWGLIYCVYCVPKSWDDDKISKEVSNIDPPGTSNNKWVCTEASDDIPEVRLQCPDDLNREHRVLNC